MDNKQIQKNLVSGGALLILTGLLTGLIIKQTAIPRIAMAAHVEGIMGGMLLILAGGVVLEYCVLSIRSARIMRTMIIYSSYSNWFFLLLASIWGAGKSLPIAAGGASASDLKELVTAAGLILSAITIVISFLILLSGLMRKKV
jgi:hydroxylaminobenzene mutase